MHYFTFVNLVHSHSFIKLCYYYVLYIKPLSSSSSTFKLIISKCGKSEKSFLSESIDELYQNRTQLKVEMLKCSQI